MPSEIGALFATYREAFNALNPDAITRLFSVPSAIITPSGLTCWDNSSVIRENMVALCHHYDTIGFLQADYTVTTIIEQGANFAIADLQWVIKRRDNQPPLIFRTGYNLQRCNHGWQIVLVTAYDEMTGTKSAINLPS